MTRWSLRRRHGVTQDEEREARPAAATPLAGRSPATPPSAGQPAADQAPAARPASSPQNGNWFSPGRGRPGQPESAQAGTRPYGAGEPGGAAQYGFGQPGGTLPGALPGAGQHGATSYGATSYGAGQYRTGQYSASQHAGRQAGDGVALLAPVQPSAPPPRPVQSAAPAVVPGDSEPGDQTAGQTDSAWPDICDQLGLHLLVLAEQLRTSLDELEADEDDPERLKRLYQVELEYARVRRL